MNPTSAFLSTNPAPATTQRRRSVRPHGRSRTAAVLALSAVVLSTLTLGATTASASTADATTAEPAANRSAGGTQLDAALGDVITAGVPGILVRIQDPHQAPRRYAAGVEDLTTRKALRPSATFRIGSVTKTFVAAVVLQLVGEGRLRLDDPVSRTLPGLLANGDEVTVRQLLNHTSGLPDYILNPELFNGIVQNRIWQPRELLALASTQPQLFPPGTAREYSNTNYIVAGLLIQAVTRHPLARELDRRIFTPLHLDHTSFPTGDEPLTGYYAHGYLSPERIPTADGPRLDVSGYNPSHAWAAGAIVSNAEDLSTFYRTLMTGKLLSPSLLTQMTTTVPEDPTDPANTFSYGLGLERVQDTCGVNWGHPGSIYGYQDMAFWNERTGRTVVIASTMSPAPAAVEAPLATATNLALCGDSASSSGAHRR